MKFIRVGLKEYDKELVMYKYKEQGKEILSMHRVLIKKDFLLTEYNLIDDSYKLVKELGEVKKQEYIDCFIEKCKEIGVPNDEIKSKIDAIEWSFKDLISQGF